MADEALACFTSLLDNVPGWIADLEDILKDAATKQEEILFTNQPATSDKVPYKKSAKSKSSSMKSGCSDERNTRRTLKSKASQLLRPQLKHLTNSDALRLSQRKRKTASVASGDQSGPVKVRAKAAVIVYYDGDTQKRFEKLVRAIGSSRNAIRKGKMSAKVDSLARTGSSSSEASGSGGDEDEEDFSPITARLNYKSTRPGRLPAFARSDNTEAFDRVDGQLEKAQSLCERAAHQILRDGDCTMEITTSKQHFSDALAMAKAELPNLERKAERAVQRKRRSEERRRAEEEAEQRRKSISELSTKVMNAVAASGTLSSDGKLEVDPLEVDDASDDEEDFNIHSIRFSKFTQMRSSRLAAH